MMLGTQPTTGFSLIGGGQTTVFPASYGYFTYLLLGIAPAVLVVAIVMIVFSDDEDEEEEDKWGVIVSLLLHLVLVVAIFGALLPRQYEVVVGNECSVVVVTLFGFRYTFSNVLRCIYDKSPCPRWDEDKSCMRLKFAPDPFKRVTLVRRRSQYELDVVVSPTDPEDFVETIRNAVEATSPLATTETERVL